MQLRKQPNSWLFLSYLGAFSELEQDKIDLFKLGLDIEEVEGYEEFFFLNYFPEIIEENE